MNRSVVQSAPITNLRESAPKNPFEQAFIVALRNELGHAFRRAWVVEKHTRLGSGDGDECVSNASLLPERRVPRWLGIFFHDRTNCRLSSVLSP